jgi:hypothetical protein
MGDNLSVREAKPIDTDGDGEMDVMLPAGRWVLPDDWYKLAGGKLWAELRPHWDIMDQPNDNIMSEPDGLREWDNLFWEWVISDEADKMEELGPYYEWLTGFDGVSNIIGFAAMAPVIGPYSSLDNYTPYINPVLGRKTILPNGELNWWDCPMPPAKIVFEITGVTDIGYFKEVDKGDVYYHLEDLDGVGPIGSGPDTILYTNPFYKTMIPDSPLIPPFVNNGGYDWNAWDSSYGPYDFWEIFNRIPYGSGGAVTPDDPQHPTKVEVYSDNHGEAMVWLNGYWNLEVTGEDLLNWTEIVSDGGTVVVGNSTVVAMADYPYFRKHAPLVSDEVTKDWTWGKEKLIDLWHAPKTIESNLLDPQKHLVVWLTDADGIPAIGEKIVFRVPENGNCEISAYLNDAGMWVQLPKGTTVFELTLRAPYPEEVMNWWDPVHNNDPLNPNPCHHAIAAVEVAATGTNGNGAVQIDLYDKEGILTAHKNPDFTSMAWMDPLLQAGLNTGLYQGPNQSVVEATETIAPYLVAIWWQDGSGVWHAYRPDAPAWANDLSTIEKDNTYWVNVQQDCNWNWSLS